MIPLGLVKTEEPCTTGEANRVVQGVTILLLDKRRVYVVVWL